MSNINKNETIDEETYDKVVNAGLALCEYCGECDTLKDENGCQKCSDANTDYICAVKKLMDDAYLKGLNAGIVSIDGD